MGYPPWYMRSSSAAPFGRDGCLGLDDMSDYLDWNPHPAAALGNDVGENVGADGAAGLGMTDARQQEFQMAQFHMLTQVNFRDAPRRRNSPRGPMTVGRVHGCAGWFDGVF